MNILTKNNVKNCYKITSWKFFKGSGNGGGNGAKRFGIKGVHFSADLNHLLNGIKIKTIPFDVVWVFSDFLTFDNGMVKAIFNKSSNGSLALDLLSLKWVAKFLLKKGSNGSIGLWGVASHIENGISEAAAKYLYCQKNLNVYFFYPTVVLCHNLLKENHR